MAGLPEAEPVLRRVRGAAHARRDSLYNNTTGPLKGLGLGFERPLAKDDDLETVQGLLRYVALERVGLPGLTGVPEGWDVFGRPPASRIELDDDEGQTFSIEAWDGSKLKATVRKARVVALEGHDLCGNQISGVPRYRRDVVPIMRLLGGSEDNLTHWLISTQATMRTTAWPQACQRRRRRTSSSAAGCGRRCG